MMKPKIKPPKPIKPWTDLPIGQFFLDESKMINMVVKSNSGKARVCWGGDGPFLAKYGEGLVIRLLDNEEIEWRK